MENTNSNMSNLDNRSGERPDVQITMPDNRNVIKLEELREAEESRSKKPETEAEVEVEEKYLDDSEIKNLIYAERGKIPSVVLDDIYENLKGRRVSKKQLKRIISRVKENLDTESKIEKIDDLYKKLDALEKLLRNFNARPKEKLTEQKEEHEGSSVKAVIKPEAPESDVKDVEQGVEADSTIQDTEISDFEGLKGLEGSSELMEPIQEVSVDNGGMEMEVVKEGILERAPQDNGSQRTNGVKLTALPPDSKGIIFLLKWIEYLVERVGYEELENVLDYYVDIGWISENVLFSILRYAKGIKLYHEKSDWRPVGYLNVQDHIMSLMFIEALRTGKFSREKIMEVEREVFRMKREAMELNGI